MWEKLIGKARVVLAAAVIGVVAVAAASAAPPSGPSAPTLLASGIQGGSGSTVGPGRALYVTEMYAGRISRVDPESGAVTTFASGLPPALFHFGGPVDVAFIGKTAYVLVTLVSFGPGAVGIYRVDGPSSSTLVADIGAWALSHPSDVDTGPLFSPTGNQYALEAWRGGFLVTDANHNRVLRVTRDGEVSEFFAFDANIVPTGIEAWGNSVYVALAGPSPHLPQDGKVVKLEPGSPTETEVAAGGQMLVDVERGLGSTLYAIGHGAGGPEFFPAPPNTGDLFAVNGDGSFSVLLEDELNQPMSLEIVKNTAYVVTFGGDVWKIADVSGPPYGG